MDVEMVETALIDHLVETYLDGDKDGVDLHLRVEQEHFSSPGHLQNLGHI